MSGSTGGAARTGGQPGLAGAPTHDVVPLTVATKAWFQISLQTFGGPAGQIAVMQHTLVDDKRWISQTRFFHALNFCMLLPGPEAQQLAIYTGWLLNGVRGGLIAGSLFVLPGMLALLALSVLYVAVGNTTVVASVFAGLAPAVIAIVLQAIRRVARRALTHPALLALAIAAFVALTAFRVPFPAVVIAAGVMGWLIGRRLPGMSALPKQTGEEGPAPLISDQSLHHDLPSARRLLTILAVAGLAWGLPLVAVATLLRSTPVFLDQALFFSGAALVTFGGAYAVLAYVAEQAVHVYGWLAPGEMVRGLALAETTPGPLIMVVQFVAFLGAFRDPGTLNPWVAGVLASLLITWVTFVPSFLFVFLGAPYVERLRGNRHLAATLTGISAAVVGVIASLAAYFALHTLFRTTFAATWGPLQLDLPVPTSFDPIAGALTAVAVGLLFWRRCSPLRTLGVCALIGALIGVVRLMA